MADCNFQNIEVNPTIEIEAEVSMGSLSSEYNAEAWAVGKRGGVAVSETDQTYQNNSKYYAQQAGQALSGATQDAEDSAEDAEAWAKGTRGGTDVETDDAAYHNNSKYYAELGQAAANTAAERMSAAQQAAQAAAGAVDDAESAAQAARQAADDAAATVVAAQGPGILYIGDDGIPFVLE